MLIEIHMIQNHSPGNLNRDDLGAPKTCYFGGVMRSRISSQCIKRSIRNPGNPYDIHNREPGMFAKAMAGHFGTRTKLFPWLVELALADSGIPQNEHKLIVLAAQRIALSPEKGEKKDDAKKGSDARPNTAQLIHLGPSYAKSYVEKLAELRNEEVFTDHYKYYLNPVAGFQEMVREHLINSELDEKTQNRIVKNSWVTVKCRMSELFMELEGEEPVPLPEIVSGNPTVEHARLLVNRLVDLHTSDKPLFEKLTNKPSEKEKEQIKEEAPEKPKNMKELNDELKNAFRYNAVDMALFGCMTTSDILEDTEAAMQVAHAVSTHGTVNEVDYFTAVDDLGKSGGGAGHVDEASFNSSCFYKYFSLDWDQLVHNLARPVPDEQKDEEAYRKWTVEVKPFAQKLAAATLGHFIRAAALVSPTGKQNSFAAHNPPDGILIEIKDTPISYANAFAKPAAQGERDIISQSIAQLAQYIHDLDIGFGKPENRFWFSPNLRYPLAAHIFEGDNGKRKPKEIKLSDNNIKSFDELIPTVIQAIGYDWEEVRKVVLNDEVV